MRPYVTELHRRWPLFGAWLILAALAYFFGGITVMIQGLVAFWTGDIIAFHNLHYGSQLLLPTVLAAAVLALPVVGLVSILCGSRRLPAMGIRKLDGATAYIFRTIAFKDVIDEFAARGFLLGLVAIPVAALTSPTIAFYMLFAVSALPQALELTVVRRKQPRLFRELPAQVVGVIFLATIFMQFGLLASVLVHLLYNLLLASTERYTAAARIGGGRVLRASFLLFLVGSYGLLNFEGLTLTHITQLHFTTFGQYLWAALSLSGLLMCVLEILGYDAEPLNVGLTRRVPTGSDAARAIFMGKYQVVTEEITPTKSQLWWGEVGNAITATVITCFWVGVAYGLDRIWQLSPTAWLATATIPALLCYISGSRSVSINGTARLLWENGPVVLLTITAFPVIGFWPATSLLVIREVTCRLIRRSLRYS